MNQSRAVRIAFLVTIATVSTILFVALDLTVHIPRLLEWIDAREILGVIVFLVSYVAATVLFIPGSLLTLGAGFVFGVVWGTIWVSIGSTIGAVSAFLVGRYLLRDWVESRIADNRRFRAIDDAVGRDGAKIVLLSRLSPIFPFNMLNYAYGLTQVSLARYFVASWIGMLPGTVMYVYLGSLAANLATLGQSGDERGMFQWMVYGIGLVATIGVTVFVTRLARRALSESVQSEVQV